MTHIRYTGAGDARILEPADFAKVGVEVDQTYTFPTGKLVEVPVEVAKVLQENDLFASDPFEVGDPNESPAPAEQFNEPAANDPKFGTYDADAAVNTGEGAVDPGAQSEGAPATGATGSTGSTSSTSGSKKPPSDS